MEIKDISEEIQEATTNEGSPSNPNPDSSSSSSSTTNRSRSVKTKVPEVEIHLYRKGKGPIEVFKSSLGGWDQDRLEVQDILDKYGFKSIYAFTPGTGRGVSIRFNSKNGRSVLPYSDGSVVYVDGEPKDSLVMPVTKILLGVGVITLIIAFVLKETPEWMKKLNISGGTFPPWVLACAVIAFTRLRKRTKGQICRVFYGFITVDMAGIIASKGIDNLNRGFIYNRCISNFAAELHSIETTLELVKANSFGKVVVPTGSIDIVHRAAMEQLSWSQNLLWSNFVVVVVVQFFLLIVNSFTLVVG